MSIDVLGADWAARYPERYPDRPLEPGRIARDPCPLCGHPTGDCAPHTEVLMAQGDTPPAAKKAPAKATSSKAGEPPAAKKAEDPTDTGPSTATEAAAASGADAGQKKGSGDSGLPAAAPGAGQPVGVNENDEVAGGGHEVSRAKSEGDPQPGVGPDSGSDAEAEAKTKKGRRKAVPDGFEDAGGNLLRATRDQRAVFVPRGTTRTTRLLVFPAGSLWTRERVESTLAGYEERGAKVE